MSTPIQITGNLTTDPELQYLSTGRPVARFTVAANSRRRTEAGEWVDGETTFFPVTVCGPSRPSTSPSHWPRDRGWWSWGPSVPGPGTPTEGERAGQTLTRLEVTAEVVAASPQWATATVTKASRSKASSTSDERDAEQTPF